MAIHSGSTVFRLACFIGVKKPIIVLNTFDMANAKPVTKGSVKHRHLALSELLLEEHLLKRRSEWSKRQRRSIVAPPMTKYILTAECSNPETIAAFSILTGPKHKHIKVPVVQAAIPKVCHAESFSPSTTHAMTATITSRKHATALQAT
jgi:hypothetical protein